MNHAARVGVRDGVANRHQRAQQTEKLQRVGSTGRTSVVIGARGLVQGLALDQPHRIEVLLIDGALRQLVHRNDSGMLELPGDLRFSQESRPSGAAAGLLGLEFLQGHVATQVVVAREPHLSDASRRVQPDGLVSRAGLERRKGRGCERSVRAPGGMAQRALNVIISEVRERLPDVFGQPAKESGSVGVRPFQSGVDQVFDVRFVVAREPAAFDQDIREGNRLASRPHAARLDELGRANQVGLEHEHAEKEIAIRFCRPLPVCHGQPPSGDKTSWEDPIHK